MSRKIFLPQGCQAATPVGRTPPAWPIPIYVGRFIQQPIPSPHRPFITASKSRPCASCHTSTVPIGSQNVASTTCTVPLCARAVTYCVISYSPRGDTVNSWSKTAREDVGAGVGRPGAVEVGLLHQLFQRAVRLEEGDAELSRHVHRMHQHAGRMTRQCGEVGRPVQVVSIERQECIRAQMIATAAQGVAGAARPFLAHHGPLRHPRLPAQVVLDLLGEVVDDHDDAVHGRRQGAERPVEDRPAAHQQHRLRRLQGVRPEAGTQAGGENDGVHTSGGPRVAGRKVPPFPLLPPLARPRGIQSSAPVTQTMNSVPTPYFPGPRPWGDESGRGRGKEAAAGRRSPHPALPRGWGRAGWGEERQGSNASYDLHGAGSGSAGGGRGVQLRPRHLRLRPPAAVRPSRRAADRTRRAPGDAGAEPIPSAPTPLSK